MQCRAKQMKVW